MQRNRDYAIAYLEHIDKGVSTQASDATILAKSLLHLGRLYFKAGTYELSHKFLNKLSEKNKVGFNEKDIEDRKTEAYLKIANIYFIMKDYENTITTLDLVTNIKS